MTTENRYWPLPNQDPATVGSVVVFAAAEGARTIDVSPLMGAGGDRAVVKVSPGTGTAAPSTEDLEALAEEARAFLSGTMRGGARVRFARDARGHLEELQARLALEGVDPGRFLGRLLFGFQQRPEEAAELEELLHQREEVAARAREPFYFRPVYSEPWQRGVGATPDDLAAWRFTAALPPRLQWELRSYAALASPPLRVGSTLEAAERSLARLALFLIPDPELRWNDRLAAPSLNPTMFAMEAAGEALLRTVRGGFDPADVAALAQALLESIRRFAAEANLLAPDTTRNTWGAAEARADLAEARATGDAEGEARARAALEAANRAPLGDDGEGHLSPMVPPWRLLTDEGEPRGNDSGELLRLDDAFASWLTHTKGDRGRVLADDVRKDARERWKARGPGLWRLWRPWFVPGDTDDPERKGQRRGHAPLAAVLLAEALWVDVVQPRLEAERERAKRQQPTIVRAVYDERLLAVMTAQDPLPGLDDLTIRDRQGRAIGTIATVDGEAALRAVRVGLHLLGTVPGHRMIKLIVRGAAEQWAEGAADPRKVVVIGGWSALADRISFKSNDFKKLQDIAQAGQHAHFTTPGFDAGGLWTYTARRGSRIRPGEVSFVVGDALMPGAIWDMGKKTIAQRVNRRQIPELRYEPPTSGASREAEHGAVWNLHRIFLLELVDRAAELVTQGGIALTATQWEERAKRANVPRTILASVLLAWTRGDDDAAPALLVCSEQAALEAGRVPREALYTLADPHDLERGFILERGRLHLSGKAAGKLSSAKPGWAKPRKDGH